MRVGEAEGTYALQAHELAGLLVAVELGELGDAQRQFAVAVRFVEIELKVVRARHRAQHEFLIVYNDGRIH